MEKCAGKAAELCALEKKTWQAVDSLSEKCLEMVYKVNQTVEKQASSFGVCGVSLSGGYIRSAYVNVFVPV